MRITDEMASAASMLVVAVGKAHYDVRRYPSHVALLTDDDREHLEQVIETFQHPWWAVIGRCTLGIIATFLIPFCVLNFKRPEECEVIGTLRTYFRVQQRDEAEEMHICMVGLKESACLALAAVSSGLVYNCAVAVVLRISLLCTTRIYSLYVKFMQTAFNRALPFTEPVVFNCRKPVPAELRRIGCVWQRLSYPAYMIAYAFAGICWVLVLHTGMDLAFSGVIVIFLLRTYLPVMAKVGAANSTLRQVVTAELRCRMLPKIRTSWAPFLRGKAGRRLAGTSDVWWRLFRLDGDVFTCSTQELDLLIQYFEHSQEGYDGKCWMYDWHDRLCLTENNTISTVYVEDLNVLLTKSGLTDPSKPVMGVPLLPVGAMEKEQGDPRSERVHEIAETFLADCKVRLQKLMDQCS